MSSDLNRSEMGLTRSLPFEHDFELTPDQRSILAGDDGEALADALRRLIQFGAAFGAKRLVPVKSVHLSAEFKHSLLNPSDQFLEGLIREGARVLIPSTIGQSPRKRFNWYQKLFHKMDHRQDRLLEALGIVSRRSALSYGQPESPRFKEILAWEEASSVIYANSVIGARSNRNPPTIALCAAVTGFAPEYGYLFDQERSGRIYIKLDIQQMVPDAVGYLVGKLAAGRTPVLDHYEFTDTELKNLGAAMAASGNVTMFHVIGRTPEAPSFRSVFPRDPESVHVLRQRDIDSIRTADPSRRDPTYIVMGCPQMTFDEAVKIARHFVGHKVNRKTAMHLLPDAMVRLKETTLYESLIDAGVELRDYCPSADWKSRSGLVRRRDQVLTSSGKLYSDIAGAKFGTTDDLLKASGVLK